MLETPESLSPSQLVSFAVKEAAHHERTSFRFPRVHRRPPLGLRHRSSGQRLDGELLPLSRVRPVDAGSGDDARWFHAFLCWYDGWFFHSDRLWAAEPTAGGNGTGIPGNAAGYGARIPGQAECHGPEALQ